MYFLFPLGAGQGALICMRVFSPDLLIAFLRLECMYGAIARTCMTPVLHASPGPVHWPGQLHHTLDRRERP